MSESIVVTKVLETVVDSCLSLNQFQLRGTLGRGSYGEVILAFDAASQCDVVSPRPSTSFTSPIDFSVMD